MASIKFVLDGSEASKLHLSALLHMESLPDGEIALHITDVPEDLALWLLSSLSALHGLTPEVAPPKSEHKENPVPTPAEEKKSAPAPSRAKSKAE